MVHFVFSSKKKKNGHSGAFNRPWQHVYLNVCFTPPFIEQNGTDGNVSLKCFVRHSPPYDLIEIIGDLPFIRYFT